MELKELRTEIDKIDDELVRLFGARMEIAAKIADYKKEFIKLFIIIYIIMLNFDILCSIITTNLFIIIITANIESKND